jgi:hypothetical protein
MHHSSGDHCGMCTCGLAPRFTQEVLDKKKLRHSESFVIDDHQQTVVQEHFILRSNGLPRYAIAPPPLVKPFRVPCVRPTAQFRCRTRFAPPDHRPLVTACRSLSPPLSSMMQSPTITKIALPPARRIERYHGVIRYFRQQMIE